MSELISNLERRIAIEEGKIKDIECSEQQHPIEMINDCLEEIQYLKVQLKKKKAELEIG
jgi:hypothetical protein